MVNQLIAIGDRQLDVNDVLTPLAAGLVLALARDAAQVRHHLVNSHSEVVVGVGNGGGGCGGGCDGVGGGRGVGELRQEC